MKKEVISAVTAFAILFTGCSANMPAPEDKNSAAISTEVSETATEASETTKAPEPLEFNPHVHTKLLDEYATDDMWNSLYNLIDALRAGEDSFECSDKKAYEWCTDPTIIGTFLPPACEMVEGAGFENGVAKIKYKIDKDKFMEREKAYEDEVVRILNEAVRSDYSDFEKTMGIYDYMCRYFQYDFGPIDGAGIEGFGDYACLMTKQGICCEIASVYMFLLLQCGVEATAIGGDGEAGFHDWTYVVIGGKGYHIDATWALHGTAPDEALSLQYFMLTEEERLANGFEKESLQPDLVWVWKRDYDISRYSATDKTFAELHNWCVFVEMDTERNVIVYKDSNGNTRELSYGSM